MLSLEKAKLPETRGKASNLPRDRASSSGGCHWRIASFHLRPCRASKSWVSLTLNVHDQKDWEFNLSGLGMLSLLVRFVLGMEKSRCGLGGLAIWEVHVNYFLPGEKGPEINLPYLVHLMALSSLQRPLRPAHLPARLHDSNTSFIPTDYWQACMSLKHPALLQPWPRNSQLKSVYDGLQRGSHECELAQISLPRPGLPHLSEFLWVCTDTVPSRNERAEWACRIIYCSSSNVRCAGQEPQMLTHL